MGYQRSRSTSSTTGGASLVLGCLKLVARIGFVAYAISKIAMGAKYRSGCPVQELVPVYSILSGCFQFLLFAFTCEQPHGSLSIEESEREAFRRKCRFITRSTAAVLNGVILLTGTVAIIHAQFEVNFGNHTTPCSHTVTSMMNTTRASKADTNQTAINLYNHSTASHQTSQPQISNNDCIVLNHDLSSTEQAQSNSNISSKVNNTADDINENMSGLNSTYITTSDGVVDAQETSSIVLCSGALLTFVTAAVCVDWFVAISGTAVLCFLWCRSNRSSRRDSAT